MALNSAKIIATFYDKFVDQLNKKNVIANLVDVDSIDIATQQNANDIYWRPVEQQRPIIVGRDLTNEETDVIEQAYPLQIDDPRGDFIQLNTSQLRDEGFMERALRSSVGRVNADMQRRIMDSVVNDGSIYYETTSGDFDLVAEADTIMTERNLYRDDGAYFLLDPRANQDAASNLASRTLYPNNRSEMAYSKDLIGEMVAGFDIYRNQYAGEILGNINSTTTDADVLEIPEGFTTANGSIQNIDYRLGTISVTDASGFAVGDVIEMGVNSVNLYDKTDTGQLMTFKVVSVDAVGNNLGVYPKPIAAGQAGITTEQAAYANIAEPILNGAVVNTTNIAVGTGRVSSFWAKDSICVVNGSEPLEMLSEFDGMKVEKTTLDNGVDLYLAYDSNLATLNCRMRVFTRYGVVNKDPSRNGNVRYTG